jgi:hypothetical protein
MTEPRLHRRQFIASTTETRQFPGWKRFSIGGEMFFEAHPDLETTLVEQADCTLALLGFIIDPDHPADGNEAVMERLVPLASDRLAFLEATNRLGGRWLLFLRTAETFLCFADPCGLRQLVYANLPGGQLFLASQPGLIAEATVCEVDPAAQSFIASEYFQKRPEYWWPAGLTLYRGISQLLPNHLLDLRARQVSRFWPSKPLETLSPQDAVQRGGKLLRDLLEAGSRRFHLALALTAGIDSRSLLAASRELKERLSYYTCIYYDLNPASPDIRVPRRLLKKLGVPHEVLDCSSSMSQEFADLYAQNVRFAHPAWGNIAHGFARQGKKDWVCIKGNCAEIARWFYYKESYPETIDGQALNNVAGFGKQAYTRQALEAWLDEARPAAERGGIDILDLFYWEQRMGSWQAMSQLEWDIVAESYTPFNCRDLLTVLLSTPRESRRPPRYPLFRDLVLSLWPEALSEPVNPVPLRRWLRDLRRQAKKSLRKFLPARAG